MSKGEIIVLALYAVAIVALFAWYVAIDLGV